MIIINDYTIDAMHYIIGSWRLKVRNLSIFKRNNNVVLYVFLSWSNERLYVYRLDSLNYIIFGLGILLFSLHLDRSSLILEIKDW